MGAICAIDNLCDRDGLSEEEYRQKKEMVAQMLISMLEKLIPGIRGDIERYELGTAGTIKRYSLNPEGSVYGYARHSTQSGFFRRVPHCSPVRNLYFSSAWSNPGGGFSGVILCGWFCAHEILWKKA